MSTSASRRVACMVMHRYTGHPEGSDLIADCTLTLGTDGMSDSLLSSHEIIDETGTREATRDARDTMRSDTSYPNL